MHRFGRTFLMPALLAASTPLFAGNLPFVEDDYAKARVEARARKLPLFIEAWAPW